MLKLNKIKWMSITFIFIVLLFISGCVNPSPKETTTATPVPKLSAPTYDIYSGYEYMPTVVSELYSNEIDRAFVRIEATALSEGFEDYNNRSGITERKFQVHDEEVKVLYISVPVEKISGVIKKDSNVIIYGYFENNIWFEGSNIYGTTIRQPWIFAHNVTVISETTPTSTPTPLPTPRKSMIVQAAAEWTSTMPGKTQNPFADFSSSGKYGPAPVKGKPFYLVVNFEINNTGYSELKIKPEYLNIIYNKAKYVPVFESYLLKDELPATVLLSYGKTKGSLLYYITEYTENKTYGVLFNDGLNTFNIDYIIEGNLIALPFSRLSTSPIQRQALSIRTSSNWSTDQSNYVDINFEITNNGYNEVFITPSFLSLIYNGAMYSHAEDSYSLKDVLPETTLLDTGILKGSLRYYVPAYTGNTTYEILFNDGLNTYNVNYTFPTSTLGSTLTITPSPTAIPNLVTVEILGSKFNPLELKIVKGTTVQWNNMDNSLHMINGGTFNSPSLNKRETWDYTFSEAGTFEYSCMNYPYMTHGKIIVSPS